MQTQQFSRETEYQSIRGLMKFSEGKGITARLLSTALHEDLTARQAQMVHLYYIEQHTMRDIANLLQINVSTVSRTLAAARKKLKRCLKYSSRAFLHDDE